MENHDIVVVGGGPAGMAAAVSAFDAGVTDIIILDREPSLGGILNQCIHNGFGLHKLKKELTGPEYAAVYEQMVRDRGIKVFYEATVTKVTKEKEVTAQSREGILKFKAKTVILAMGCRERSRGALNICGSRPAGIYSAGTAQKLMNCEGYMVGKRAVILGSGDIGLIMARRMSLEGAKVEAVCELLPYSGGLTRNIVQCLEDFDIPLYLSTTVTKIHGQKRLEGVTIAEVDEDRHPIANTERYIPCDTLLLSVGLIPENELTRGAGIAIDSITGGALVDNNCQTDTEGIFACGNVLQVHDLVDYASDEAERAGKAAAELVKNGTKACSYAKTNAGEGVRYVVPQKLDLSENELTLFLRVTAPMKRTQLTVSCNGKVVASFKRPRVAPGEMEKLTLKADKLQAINGDITVEAKEI